MNEQAKRYNSVRVQWSAFLTPTEYVLLDTILFRSNLTKANNGEGYRFHVRQLARDCHMSKTEVGRIISRWNFMKKRGVMQSLAITLDYQAFEKWLTDTLNNQKKAVPQRDKRGKSAVPYRDKYGRYMSHTGTQGVPYTATISKKEKSTSTSKEKPDL